jgi:hypothetical protein
LVVAVEEQEEQDASEPPLVLGVAEEEEEEGLAIVGAEEDRPRLELAFKARTTGMPEGFGEVGV